MLGPAKAAIKTFIAAAGATSWPMRWQNDRWADTVTIDDNDNPTDVTGAILPFVELEIIGGKNEMVGFSTPGNRLYRHDGLIRLYLCVPAFSGTDAADAVDDAFSTALERKQITISASQMVRTHDYSSTDGAAEMTVGNYFVLMSSVSFEFLYEA